MLLILDLDNTIFETRTMDFSVFDSAIRVIEQYAIKEYGKERSGEIIEALKSTPFDIVADKYKFPEETILRFHEEIKAIPFQLDINVYEDYPSLKALPYRKYLVSNGIGNLQHAKIRALNIASDFHEICIDDPFDNNRKYKQGIFLDILNKETIDPKQVWVIGDNPDSELKAGKALGMHTIQRLSPGVDKSTYSDHAISSFEELKEILLS